MRHLTAIIFDKRVSEAWSTDYLPLVQRIMNAKVHDPITGIAFYTGINDFYHLLRVFTPPLRLFTPLYAPLQITFLQNNNTNQRLY